MIVGSGQLAKEFEKSEHGDVVIFASGVSNSTCKDENEFIREKNLLESMLNSNKEKKIVYFSSCALSAPDYAKNAYYEHKKQMEELIRLNSNNYYIFRIPQLFGKLKHHKTLINFLYEAIINGDKFNVYSGAYRYVIEIEDVRKLVEAYLNYSEPNIVVDIANTYRYNILEVVSILERLLGKKAIYDVIEKSDEYVLDLSRVQDFIKRNSLDVHLSQCYLETKLKKKM